MVSYVTINRIKQNEALRLRLYPDSVGKLTIGWGHNIQDKGISQAVADMMFDEDLHDAEADLLRELPWTTMLDPVRKEVLVEMSFNMGIKSLLTFKATLSALQTGDYKQAAGHMLDSLWHKQVGARAETLAKIIETGEV